MASVKVALGVVGAAFIALPSCGAPASDTPENDACAFTTRYCETGVRYWSACIDDHTPVACHEACEKVGFCKVTGTLLASCKADEVCGITGMQCNLASRTRGCRPK